MAQIYQKELHPCGFSIALSADYENIGLVCQDVEIWLKDQHLHNFSFEVLLCVREALVNAIKHGSEADPAKQVFFQLGLQKKQLIIKVHDTGPGFDWASRKNTVQDSTTCSGRGIKILHQYFDTVTFNKQGNTVELRKNFTAAQENQTGAASEKT